MPPLLHAWCVRDGQAIDPTVPRPGRYAFLGVVVVRAGLIDTLKRQGHYVIFCGSLAGEFTDRWRKVNAAGR